MECTVDTRQDSDSTCVLGAYTRCGWLFLLLVVDIGTAGGSTSSTIVAGVQVAPKVRERRRRRCRTSSMVGGASKWWRRWFVATDHERYRKHRGSVLMDFLDILYYNLWDKKSIKLQTSPILI